jgi:hypothetical protein
MEQWLNQRDSGFTKEAATTDRSAQPKHGTSNKLSKELLTYSVGITSLLKKNVNLENCGPGSSAECKD